MNRERILESYLVGERVRAKQNGEAWDRERAEAEFDRFIIAERMDALGVTQETVDLGASLFMRNTSPTWDTATPEQRVPYQKAVRALLIAVREHKRKPTSGRGHGTRAKYTKDGCLCPDCTRANLEYLEDLKARKEAGKEPLISASRSQAYLRGLIARGYTLDDLASRLGFAHSSLSDILGGKAKRVHPETEQKIGNLARTSYGSNTSASAEEA